MASTTPSATAAPATLPVASARYLRPSPGARAARPEIRVERNDDGPPRRQERQGRTVHRGVLGVLAVSMRLQSSEPRYGAVARALNRPVAASFSRMSTAL